MFFNIFLQKFDKVEKPKSFKDEDDLYSFLCASFTDITKEIEEEYAHEINKDDYEDHEEWYDEYHDEVIQAFYSKM